MSRAGAWPAEVAHRPVCPQRNLPIPFINEITPDGTGLFAILDDRQGELCLKGRLCAMCGLPMGAEVALIGDVVSLKPGGMFVEAPVHERCGEVALVDGPRGRGLCPYMAGERVPRRPPAPGTTLVGTATPDRLVQVGRTVPKRDWYMAITREYGPALTPSSTGGLVMVYMAGPPGRPEAGRIERSRRFAYGPDGWLAEVVPAPAARFARTQPHRTTRARRRGAR